MAIHEECYALKMKLENTTQGGPLKSRPWRVIATEAWGEQNPDKLAKLVAELNQALDEQNFDGTPKV